MAEATCGVCSGTGGVYATDYDESGRPSGRQAWEPCQACGGAGLVWVPDEEPGSPAKPQPASAPRRQRRSWGRSDRLTSEKLDRSFRNLLTLIFVGLLGWAALVVPVLKDMNPWVLLGGCLVFVGLFYWALTLIPGVIRVLRLGFAWFLVLGLGLAFAVGIYLVVG